jgi:hypothetical protein
MLNLKDDFLYSALIAIALMMVIPNISAEAFYKISGDRIIFTIPAEKETYNYATLTINEKVTESIKLCNKERCKGTLKVEYLLKNITGYYSLKYYDFNNYLWRNISLTIGEEQIKQLDFNKKNENQNANQKNSVFKKVTVVVICRISNIFGGYEECRDKYLVS